MESSFGTACPHLQQICNPHALERLSRAAEAIFAPANRPVVGVAPESVLKCLHPDCTHPLSSDLYVCVHCVHIACSARPIFQPLSSSYSSSASPSTTSVTHSPASGHVIEHQKATSHSLYISVDHAHIFCTLCKDFVFHQYLDPAISLQARYARALRSRFNSTLSPLDPAVSTSDSPSPNEHSLQRVRDKRRRLLNLRDWVPSQKELDSIAAHSLLFSNIKTVRPPVGLFNLGNSCYMNSVLQAFLNAPPLRNFFLADEHKPHCPKDAPSDCFACAIDTLICESCFTVETKPSPKEKTTSPSSATLQVPFLVPQTVLDIVWRNADHLASYAQHDAHEFLIAALNLLNTHCRRESFGEKKKEKGEPVLVELKLRKEALPTARTPESKREGLNSISPITNIRVDPGGELGMSDLLSGNLTTSIVQSLFSGTLQSDVICRVCGNSSPTLEKFYAISLDVDKFLKPVPNRRGRTSSPGGDGLARSKGNSSSGAERGGSKGKHDSKNKDDQTDSQNGDVDTAKSSPQTGTGTTGGDGDGEKPCDSVNTLHECLARFTDPEMLGASSKMHCMTCGTRQEAMKQMSIRTLPPIICFHFKRFEKSFASIRRSEMVKIDTPVEFPADGLEMTTFLTSEVLRKRMEADTKSTIPQQINSDSARTSRKRKDSIVQESEQTIYDLFAVVNHIGKIDSGHYTAQVRRDGTWFQCDDEKVSQVGDMERIVRSEKAYLVFYMQRYPNIQY